MAACRLADRPGVAGSDDAALLAGPVAPGGDIGFVPCGGGADLSGAARFPDVSCATPRASLALRRDGRRGKRNRCPTSVVAGNRLPAVHACGDCPAGGWALVVGLFNCICSTPTTTLAFSCKSIGNWRSGYGRP